MEYLNPKDLNPGMLQWCEDADAEVVAAFYATLGRIEAAGGEVVQVQP